ncbi:MAG: hypothetical protein LBE35_01575 [Clostridiales bacterium]|nr:hypothetical protein [Clostridiales bacterium]
MDKIKVFDKNNEMIGETFARRAKQLVLKGRATWANPENSAIRLLEANKKEEIMTNNGYIDLRDEAAETTPKPSKPGEDLLMYIAKRNVAARRDLIFHVAAFPIAFVIIMLLTDGFIRDTGYFFLGIFFSWGLLIAYKAFNYFKGRASSRSARPDPIKAEFERLKGGF